MRRFRMRLIRTGGFIAWIAVGLPVIVNGATDPWRMLAWCAAFVAFGAAFLFSSRSTPPPRAVLAIEPLAVAGMVFLLCNGFEGTLLVLVAMQLGGSVSRREGLAWIVAQTLLASVAMAIHWTPRSAILVMPPYLGFQILALFVMEALAREAAARRDIARAHAELRAVHEILADSSRIAERLRISRELHDALGHHLTALSLNIEVAIQKSDAATRPHLDTAQSLTRKLLGDVREIAAAVPDRGDVDLAQALQSLVSDVPRPRIHLQIQPGMRVDDPEQAHVIVRCTQEIVTNAVRHSSASNLWIVIARDGGALRIEARDDGTGAAELSAGFGLRSMRDRVEGAGGELHVASRPGSGFEVVALLPGRSPA